MVPVLVKQREQAQVLIVQMLPSLPRWLPGFERPLCNHSGGMIVVLALLTNEHEDVSQSYHP